LRTARLLAAVADRRAPPPFVILTDANGVNIQRVRNAGRIRPEHGLSDDQWAAFAEGAGGIARAVREETGLRTVFHHHCGGFVETPAETVRLLEMTDADDLGLCFDTGHWALGGGDVLEALEQYRQRIWHVHFKEYHAGIAAAMAANDWDYFEGLANRVFHRLGTGEVPFPALLESLRASGYDGWIVVEDELPPGMGCPEESARADREYLRGLGV
jgi:inosose dehydratase